MSILGYDCDGKPIRAGDKVVIVDFNTGNDRRYLPMFSGEVFNVVRPFFQTNKNAVPGRWVVIDKPGCSQYIKVNSDVLKKLDQDQSTIPWSECVWQPKMKQPPKQSELDRQIAEYQRNGGKIEQIEPGKLAKREGPASNNIKRANGVKV